MRFRYPLQKIVDLKEGEKDQAEWRLAEAIRLQHDEEVKLHKLTAERRTWERRMLQFTGERTSVAEVQTIQTYLDDLDKRIAAQNMQLTLAKDKVSARKKKLKQKLVDEKVWTATREKARWKHWQEMLKKEQDELDDIATTRFSHT